MTSTRKPEVAPALESDSLTAWAGDWNRFWFRPSDPTTLGLMRLCCGVLIVYVHLSYSWGLLSYVGDKGWLDLRTLDEVRHKEQVLVLPSDWGSQPVVIDQGRFIWSVFFHVTDPFWIWAFHLAVLAVMVLFTLGLWTRITSVLAWAGSLCFIHRAPTLLFGMDTMSNIVLLYLMIGPCGDVLSLDRWLARRAARRRGQPEPPVEPSVSATFATRLTQVHFCIIYLAAGTSKLLGAAWWNATAPSLVMLNYNFAPMSNHLYSDLMTWLVQHRPLWEVLSSAQVLFTFVVEIGLPFLIWQRRTRWLMMCGSVLMHTGIGLFMGLVTFSLMMLVMLLAFMPPEVVKWQIGRLTRQARRLFQAHDGPAQRRRADELVLSR